MSLLRRRPYCDGSHEEQGKVHCFTWIFLINCFHLVQAMEPERETYDFFICGDGASRLGFYICLCNSRAGVVILGTRYSSYDVLLLVMEKLRRALETERDGANKLLTLGILLIEEAEGMFRVGLELILLQVLWLQNKTLRSGSFE